MKIYRQNPKAICSRCGIKLVDTYHNGVFFHPAGSGCNPKPEPFGLDMAGELNQVWSETEES